ncbi:hypothetical protein QBC35DRAFT_491076 [Podospora australis]|uniref:Uncharacterized protein n=1 Tax=Podospora australis TaxID=1536484 RepID=A0AAN6X2E3_9PEZI|nr:hypothetical protein QBC35DRAFT_491076 [Podospora australis]
MRPPSPSPTGDTTPSAGNTSLPKQEFNNIFNLLNLSMSKRMTAPLVSSLQKHKKSSTSSSSVTPSATSTSTGKGFSSLTTSAKPSSKSYTLSNQQNGSGRERDDREDFFPAPPNAGVGFSTQPATSAASQADRDLRKKILGTNALKQKEDAAKRNGRGRGKQVDSDSEEELGRSALGKGSKKRATTLSSATEKKRETVQLPRRKRAREEDSDQDGNVKEEGSRPAVTEQKTSEEREEETKPRENGGSPATDGVASGEQKGETNGGSGSGEAERKRKKRKKNKSKKKAGADAVEE